MISLLVGKVDSFDRPTADEKNSLKVDFACTLMVGKQRISGISASSAVIRVVIDKYHGRNGDASGTFDLLPMSRCEP